MTTVWSTESVGASEGFSYWQDAVCRAVLNVSTESPPEERFRARIAGRSCGPLRFASFNASGHDIVRRSTHVSSMADGGYLVSLQQRGFGQIEQGDCRFVLGPGEIAILDGERPFRVGFPQQVQRLVSVIPRTLLDRRAPWIRNAPARRISGQSPLIDLARRHLIQLAQAEPDPCASDAALLAENLCNLLAILTTPDGATGHASSDAKLEILLSMGRQHLADPELTPEKLAALCGISVRTLHVRFKKLGCTWSQWVLEGRLDACKAALADSRHVNFSISDIAYRWGFNDLSHFNKSFRRRYNMTPGQWRFESTS